MESMRGQSPVLFLAVLVTTVGVISLPTRPPTSSPAPAKGAPGDPAPAPGAPGADGGASQAPKPAGPTDADRATEPIGQFLSEDGRPRSRAEILRVLGQEDPPADLEVLIATLPDPIDSRGRFLFDEMLDAIQRAVESEGYFLDRFLLSWSESAAAPPRGELTRVASRLMEWRDPGPPHRTRPGVILYRKGGDRTREGEGPARPRLLALLLVGEAPTWGLQKGAFRAALDLAEELSGAPPGGGPGRPIRILGPSFSGTKDSMASVLAPWAASRPDARFWICSGSATNVDKGAFEGDLPGGARFACTLIPREIVLSALLDAMGGPSGAGLDRLALLTESDSAFGVITDMTDALKDRDPGPGRRASPAVVIKFPMHIAQIRSAVDQESRPAGAPAAPPGRVSVALADRGATAPDVVPAFHPEMTTGTEYLVLSDIISTIAREDIRYVGINATDTRDILFLARMIRDYNPDIQLFLIGGDLLYVDPRFSHDFRGTLVGSTFPLDSRGQNWSYPFRGHLKRMVFSSEVALGVFNACVVLLNGRESGDRSLSVPAARAKKLLSYGRPFEEALAGDPPNQSRPPVWISVVGQHALLPLGAVPVQSPKWRDKYESIVPAVDRGPSEGPPGRDRDPSLPLRLGPRLPAAWTGVVVALMGAALGLVGVAFLALLRPRAARPSGSAVGSFLEMLGDRSPGRSSQNQLYYSACAAALFVPLADSARVLAVLMALERASGPGAPGAVPRLIGPVLAAMALLWASMWPWFFRVDWRARLARADRWVAPLGALAILVATGALGAWAVGAELGSLRGDPARLATSLFRADRSINLMCGASPTIPALFLGATLFAWGASQLERLHLLYVFRRDNPITSALASDSTDRGPDPGASEGAGRRRIWGPSALIARLRPGPRRSRGPSSEPDPPLPPWASAYPAFASVRASTRDVNRIVWGPLRDGSFWAVIAGASALGLVAFGGIRDRFIPTPEGPGFDSAFLAAFALISGLMVLAYARFLMLWGRLARLFRGLCLLPIASAFDRLPPKVSAHFGRFLQAPKLADVDLALSRQQLSRLRASYGDEARSSLEGAGCTPGEISRIDEAMRRPPTTDPAPDEGRARDDLREAAVALLPAAARSAPARPVDEAFGRPISSAPSPSPGVTALPTILDPGASWMREAEDFLATQVVFWVTQYSAHLRNLISFLTIGPLLLLLATTWYPFQPQRLLAAIIWTFILASALTAVAVLVRIDRDEFVSRVSKTRANFLNLDRAFLSNVLTYLVPVLGLILASFPDVSYWVNSLFEPLGRVLK